MDALSFNIAVLPDQTAAQLVIEMSKKIANEIETRFVLDGKNLYPHITIYQAHYPLNNLDKLKAIVKKISQKNILKEIVLDSSITSYGTFIFWNCIDDGNLRSIHNLAVSLANPLREGLGMPQLADRENVTADDKYDIKHFGSLLIGPHYIPHITITRIKNIEDASKAVEISGQRKQVSFKPRSIILGSLGDHGTVTGVVEEFSFN